MQHNETIILEVRKLANIDGSWSKKYYYFGLIKASQKAKEQAIQQIKQDKVEFIKSDRPTVKVSIDSIKLLVDDNNECNQKCCYFTSSDQLTEGDQYQHDVQINDKTDELLQGVYSAINNAIREEVVTEIENLTRKFSVDFFYKNNEDVYRRLKERAENNEEIIGWIKQAIPPQPIFPTPEFMEAVENGQGEAIKNALQAVIITHGFVACDEHKVKEAAKNIILQQRGMDGFCLYPFVVSAFVEECLNKERLELVSKYYDDKVSKEITKKVIAKLINEKKYNDLINGNYYRRQLLNNDDRMFKQYVFFCLMCKRLDKAVETIKSLRNQTQAKRYITNANNNNLDIDSYLFFADCAMQISDDAEKCCEYLMMLPEKAIPNRDEKGLFSALRKAEKDKNKICSIYCKMADHYGKEQFKDIANKIQETIPIIPDIETLIKLIKGTANFDPDMEFNKGNADLEMLNPYFDKVNEEGIKNINVSTDRGYYCLQFVIKFMLHCGLDALDDRALALCTEYAKQRPELYFISYLIKNKQGKATEAMQNLVAAKLAKVPYAEWRQLCIDGDVENIEYNELCRFAVDEKITEAECYLGEYFLKDKDNDFAAKDCFFQGYLKGYNKSAEEYKKLAIKYGMTDKQREEMRDYQKSPKKKHWLEQAEDLINGIKPVPPTPIFDEQYIRNENRKEKELQEAYNNLEQDAWLRSLAAARLGEIYYIKYALAKVITEAPQGDNISYFKMYLASAEKSVFFSPKSKGIFPQLESEITTGKLAEYAQKAKKYLCDAIDVKQWGDIPNGLYRDTADKYFAWSAFYVAQMANDEQQEYKINLLQAAAGQGLLQATFKLSTRNGDIQNFEAGRTESFDILTAYEKLRYWNEIYNDQELQRRANNIEESANVVIPQIQGDNNKKEGFFSYNAIMTQLVFDIMWRAGINNDLNIRRNLIINQYRAN